MKLAVFSDPHIGVSFGDVPRDADIAAAIESMIAGIASAGVDRIVCLGDLYDSPDPSTPAHRMGVSLLVRLAEIQRVDWVVGNHEVSEREDVVDAPAVIEAMRHQRIAVIRTMGGHGALQWVIPHVPRWTDVDGDVNARIRASVSSALEMGRRVFWTHTNIAGARIGAADVYERGHTGSRKPTFPLDLLRQAGPVTVHIPGSLVRMGFAEASDTKGWLVVDTDKLEGLHVFAGHYHGAQEWTVEKS